MRSGFDARGRTSTWLYAATVLLAAVVACSDDGGSGDGGSKDGEADSGPKAPIQFEAESDPEQQDGCMPEPPAAGEARAKPVQCEDELLSGSVAMGRVGDVLIDNEHARFVIRTSTEAASLLGAYGGGVVDAAPHGTVDLLKEMAPVVSLAGMRPREVVVTEAGGQQAARVRVLFDMAPIGLIRAAAPAAVRDVPLKGAIDYELRPGERSLRVTVTLTTQDEANIAGGTPGLVPLVGGAAELMQPGRALLAGDPTDGPQTAELVGEALDAPSAFAARLDVDEGSLGSVGSINLMTAGSRKNVQRGERIQFTGRLSIADTAARAYNALRSDEQEGLATLELSGPAGDRVEIRDAEGRPVLRTRFDDEGRAAPRLSPGQYSVRTGFARDFLGAARTVQLEDSGTQVALEAAPSGTLRVEATAGGDAQAPVRVTARATESGQPRTLVASGPTDFRLPPGDYRVTLSRGIEFDIHQRDLTVADGETVTVEATLDRVVDTDGWVAGDFHLHSEMSTDSRHALADAVRMLAAEGLEVAAATDHDFLTDYGPALEALGLDDRVLTVTGVELSHPVIAHVGAYPLERDPSLSAGGAPEWFEGGPSQWFDELRELGDPELGGAVVQLNHPRRDSSGLFTSIGFDRESLRATASPEDLGLPGDADLQDFDFDAIEVWNKSPDENDRATFRDYLALYEAGQHFAMMGNSDSHDRGRPAGSTRTYAKVPDDTPGSFTWQQVRTAIDEQNLTVSTGIFVTAELAGEVTSGGAPLRIRVQAAPWVEVDRLTVYAGRNVALERELSGSQDPVRFDQTLDVSPMGADFFVVMAEGDRPPRPVIKHRPIGVTNPIDLP